MKKLVKKLGPAYLFTLLTLSVVGCGTNEEKQEVLQVNNDALEEQPMEEIKMASWSQSIVEQSNLYLADEKGWFDEAGLDFEYIPGSGGGDAVRNIISGNADIAFANVEAVLLALEQGEELRVIYNIYPENVFNIVSLKDSNINTMEDLRGKDVGVYSRASGTYQNLLVLLHQAGMTEEDVNIIETGVLNFGPLMNNQVVATAATDTGLFDAQQNDIGEVDVMEAKDVLNTPADVFVVTEDVFQEKEDMLLRFLQVYRDSVNYTMDQPEEAAEIAVDAAIDGQDKDRNIEIIHIRNKSSTNDELEEKGLGWLNTEVLQEVEEVYYDLGLLEERVNIENFTTNEFVEQLE
ncbi:ABC transporter substrate-binding protein [Salipaludibacillus sp. CF4.18]|uniref:ABC transporter substrate-binding protein n=1 Tax=Salipaludibacillus sp. CF4.18 TaxID=3373081 RepID=UPI003EE56B31